MIDVIGDNACVFAVYPALINKMVVMMMDASSDKRASEHIFQCILNLWRTLYDISSWFDGLRAKIVDTVSLFVSDETTRRKQICPDIGHTLVLGAVNSHVSMK